MDPDSLHYRNSASSEFHVPRCTEAFPVNPGPDTVIRSKYLRSASQVAQSVPSIREFIASESPVLGFSGKYRERPRESTVEAALIGLEDVESLVIPGVEAVMRVEQAILDQVIGDEGQVVLSVMAPGETPTTLPPPKGTGSYAVLAQVFGVQRLPGSSEGGFVRLRAEQRVLVQAIQSGGGGEDGARESALPPRAQAAVLPDRWAYYVQGSAIEGVLEQAQQKPGGNNQPADVRFAVASLQDVGRTPRPHPTAPIPLIPPRPSKNDSLTDGRGGRSVDSESSEMLAEAVDEAERLLKWCMQRADDRGTLVAVDQSGVGDVLSFTTLERLSYAPLAIAALGKFAGVPRDELQALRAKAMEASDLGMRLESAVTFAISLANRLVARAALDSMRS
eukprot:gene24041-9618_t